jgi:hypothetical protein
MSRPRIILVIGSALGIVLIWMSLAGPVLVRGGFGAVENARWLMIWNPLRNKGPEKFGAEVLSSIQSPQCSETLARFALPDQQAGGACEKQQSRPLLAPCPLVERRDMDKEVWLLFKCAEKAYQGNTDEIGISLERSGQTWELVRYERID